MNIESEILKNEWNLIGNIFEKAQEKYDACAEKNETDKFKKYEEVVEFLGQEYEKLYPQFVLEPYKENIINLFYSVQTKEFEEWKNISNEIARFVLTYYLRQYLYISICPNFKDDSERAIAYQLNFEIKTKDENKKLFEIFKEIWVELNKDNDSSEFDSFKNFEEIASKLLLDFLSECWRKAKEKAKEKSNSTVLGIMWVLGDNDIEQLGKKWSYRSV